MKLNKLSFSVRNSILIHLKLSFNNLTTLSDDQFKYLTKLKKINLKNNELTTIDELLFYYNTRLLVINVSHNKLKSFNLFLEKYANLHRLYINANLLQELNQKTFISYLNNDNRVPGVSKYIDIRNNKLVCDCELSWIRGLRNLINITMRYYTVCHGEQHRGIALECFLGINFASCPRYYQVDC